MPRCKTYIIGFPCISLPFVQASLRIAVNWGPSQLLFAVSLAFREGFACCSRSGLLLAFAVNFASLIKVLRSGFSVPSSLLLSVASLKLDLSFVSGFAFRFAFGSLFGSLKASRSIGFFRFPQVSLMDSLRSYMCHKTSSYYHPDPQKSSSLLICVRGCVRQIICLY